MQSQLYTVTIYERGTNDILSCKKFVIKIYFNILVLDLFFELLKLVHIMNICNILNKFGYQNNPAIHQQKSTIN